MRQYEHYRERAETFVALATKYNKNLTQRGINLLVCTHNQDNNGLLYL